MRCRWYALPVVFLTSVFAYNPPTDTAGPVTASMQAPAIGNYGAGGFADLSRPGVRMILPVTLQNASDQAIAGTLRVAVIDDWTVEPAAAIPFRLAPHGRARHEFTLSFGRQTYNARYPVHTYAEFEYRGERLVAHPVLILETHIPDLVPPKLPAEWKPVAVPAGGTLGLWRLPVRRETAEVVNDGAEAGATGGAVFDAGSIIEYGLLARTPSREGIAMRLGPRRPSGRENVARAAVLFPIALPATKPLRLRFAIAGNASFRVEAGSALIFERTLAAREWQSAEVDLDKYAGTNIELRLEAAGAAGDGLWAEPTLVAGSTVRVANHVPDPLGRAADCDVSLARGSRGLLDARISFHCGNRELSFNGFRVRVAGDALEDWRASTELLETRDESSAGHPRVRHRFRNWAGRFDVLVELWVERDALRARFWLENAPAPKPWFNLYLEGVSAGTWSQRAARVYAGPGNVIENPKAFRLGFDGHNLATSFVGFDFANGQALVQNSDAIPDRLEVDPGTRIYSLVTPHSQTLEFFPADNVFTGVKRIREQDQRRASKGVPKVAGRFTFDLWSGRYAESARALERAATYGITDAMVVWHNWQRWGYDYRLPDIYPPNPQFGTLEEFRRLVETCKRAGTLFAPHDNYIDFYPDFEGFTYRDIVFRQNGTPYRAWFNYGREAQAYRARPDRLLSYVQRNVKLIKDSFAPTAYFIDVWSSMAPYDYWTDDGRFVDRTVTAHTWGEVFAWIRDCLGSDAPQISEAGHDKLIGWLDGAQAQQLRVDAKGQGFTWRIECSDSERIPWIDVAWHDKFILHGAGYEGRYQGGLSEQEHGAYSDDYISTEVLSGRPAMVPQPFNRNVVRVYWLLDEPMKALALDRIAAVDFAGNNIHRQHVKWERGAEVWVNRGVEPWTVEGHTLPQYGFYLRAGKVEASIETRGGARVEWSRSLSSRYENGRRMLATGEVIDLPPE